jgi:hypothetical protein
MTDFLCTYSIVAKTLACQGGGVKYSSSPPLLVKTMQSLRSIMRPAVLVFGGFFGADYTNAVYYVFILYSTIARTSLIF